MTYPAPVRWTDGKALQFAKHVLMSSPLSLRHPVGPDTCSQRGSSSVLCPLPLLLTNDSTGFPILSPEPRVSCTSLYDRPRWRTPSVKLLLSKLGAHSEIQSRPNRRDPTRMLLVKQTFTVTTETAHGRRKWHLSECFHFFPQVQP